MSQRTAARLAWSVWLLVVLAAAAMLILSARNNPAMALISALMMLAYVAIGAVGALVVSRRPQNAIGWIFVAGALWGAAGALSLEYAVYALITAPGTVAGGAWAAWLGDWARTVSFTLIMYYVLLLFPDGRLPSRRWRLVGWLPVAGMVVYVASGVFAIAPNDLRLTVVPNPFGLGPNEAVSNALGTVWFLLAVANLVLSATAAIVRFRRARGDEREQMKWFAYAATLALGLILIAFGLVALNLNNIDALTSLMFTVAIGGIPVATGIAILKYRLYAIDLLIRRTLVYAVLTGLLALVYFGSVVALQAVFTTLTGEGRSELVTVLSTLAIAALFVPLRRRVQAFIDRRFYRRKYDATRTLAEFGATLRDEVDLDQLSAHLLAAVDETMQPESVALVMLAAAAPSAPPRAGAAREHP